MTTIQTSGASFADLGVDQPIVDALAREGITAPFPIQEQTLPLALSGADVIGQARTGTGKTLAFGIPLLQRIDPEARTPRALVVVPTRELCLQVYEDLARAGAGRGITPVAIFGGRAIEPQAQALRDGAQVVVGTPGRLLDLMSRGALTLRDVRGLVLDEADEMLDMGFLPDVEQLVQACPTDRQTLLFSATMPSEVVGLARRYMSKPTFMRADVEEAQVAPATDQYFLSCHRLDKPAVLARILDAPGRGLALVFTRTKRMADTLVDELAQHGKQAEAIHSNLRQEARERTLQKFRDGKIDVLCATEVAARGLDIPEVTHVVNYDCPDDEKMYLHRIGRTGRAGAAGVAVTLAVWNELARVEVIKKALGVDTPTHEVFSTSPELEALFDLPPRQQSTRSRGSGGKRAAEPDTQRRDGGGKRDESDDKRASERPGGAEERNGRRGKRRGGRGRQGGGERRGGERDSRTDGQPAGPKGSADSGAERTRAPSESGTGERPAAAAGREPDATDETPARTRVRRREVPGPDTGREATSTDRSREREAPAPVDDVAATPSRESAREDVHVDEGGVRRRVRRREAPGDGSASTASAPAARQQRRRSETRSKAGDRDESAGQAGVSARSGSAGGDGSAKSDQERSDQQRSDQERSDQGRSEQERSRGRGGSNRSRRGGRGRGSGGGNARQGERERTSGGGREAVDSAPATRDTASARGDGRPGLSRPMTINHLP
ncbi:DEAD/DEAH box helicase [Egibacter rhizosphaerae]|uniref:DEAD/DEAH box helicase n=1 Tax=Egibacter rhizosphaerae TaxID=1670831 RepID=UPI00197A74D9|nr:DEAD/DEAH box helicase [Egibacter rhizosphaerae]